MTDVVEGSRGAQVSAGTEHPPRVVMLRTRAFPPEPRGLREARALRDAGFSVCVLGWDRVREFPARESIEGIDVARVRVPCGESLFPAYLTALPLFWLRAILHCLKDDVSVIHCADLDTLPVGLLAKKLRGTKVVYDAYEDYSGMVTASVPRMVASFLDRLDRRLSLGADLVVSVSPPLLERYAGARAILLVPNAADPEEFERVSDADAREFRRIHGVGDQLLLLYVGVLMPGRGIEHCIAATETLDGVRFVIGGFGQLEPEIRRLVTEAKNSSFIGRVKPEEVPRAVRAADALVEVLDPSNGTYRVSMPNKLFESVMAGVPLVASSGTYPGRFVEEHGTGIAVAYGDVDAIRDAIVVLKERRGSSEWTENSSRIREKFAWKGYARSLVDAYSRLLGRV